MSDAAVAMLAATIAAATPLVFAALGELVAERAGVLNLGVEGMMLVGALAGFATAATSGSVWLGAVAGAAAGAAMAAIFALLTVNLVASQVASGLALTLFGAGLSAFAGKPFESVSLPQAGAAALPALASVPVLGPIVFGQHALVFVSWGLLAVVHWFLVRSRAGLVLRAVGESPGSAHAIGCPVLRVRWLAALFGGALAGLGGAYLAEVHAPMWAESLVAGRGWIALALVVFATWRPVRLLFGAYLFGGVTVGQFFAQAAGVDMPSELLSALPYLSTIAVLVIISRDQTTIRLNSPMSLGRPFRPE
jgi:simple sugar transport system permease protein